MNRGHYVGRAVVIFDWQVRDGDGLNEVALIVEPARAKERGGIRVNFVGETADALVVCIQKGREGLPDSLASLSTQ